MRPARDKHCDQTAGAVFLPCAIDKRLTVLVLTVGLGAALPGCVTPRVDVAATDQHRLIALHRARVESVASWRLAGKVSIAYDGKVWRARLDWFHYGNGDQISLAAPGGRTVLRLENRSGNFSAEDSKGRVYHASSFEELALETFGINVPFANLGYWVTGITASGSATDAVDFNENGSAKTLRQDGWEVRYREYQPVPSFTLQPIAMPSFLALERDGIKLTVAIKHWQFIKFKARVDTLI